MIINKFQVLEIRSLSGVYKFGHPVAINDEGSFYHINGSYIIDKFQIKSIEIMEKQILIQKDDGDVVLIIRQKSI